MGKAGPRLKDIAEHTGFSVNTVSLALRDSPRIPPETRKKIRLAADQLNYLPNQIAQSLVSRETKSIGLILTDLQNPVLTHVAQAIETELAKRGYATLFATSNNNLAEEAKMVELFRQRRADGMLIFPCSHRRLEHIKRLRDRNYPVVLLVGDPDAGIDAVSMDERAGAYAATRHLLDIGHRKIALVDGAQTLGNTEKIEGYRQAHADCGVEIDRSIEIDPTDHSVAAGYWAMAKLMARNVRFSGLFASNDSLALGVLRYCTKHGIRVPENLSIVGYDNIEFGEYATTPLTSVDYDVERVSSMAVERVIGLIRSEDALPAPNVLQIEPNLIVRQSTMPKA
ncbi:LacI family DNA-binding transcriptional regulator [Qingshengfaniella alkalisoli]|uniref:LacI family transcriptional regulator n=1 Tax=Qingshengfaniella alkalisoli TaxID=2599296 RepID=A0A5B8IAQ9_9RHOB|nr:LacI family DNA-binding transcriptional regulator [Qingshengfaniella alkalisoli]QDY70436.1 LacI family transcriptional regulator [Qingshengfaniella alkalisoli]